MKKAYRFEVGIFLNKDNEEYDVYSQAFDKKHAYFEENCGICKTKKEALDYVEDYIKYGTNNTYGVINIENITNEEFEDINNGFSEQIDYNSKMENIIFAKYKNENGNVLNLF